MLLELLFQSQDTCLYLHKDPANLQKKLFKMPGMFMSSERMPDKRNADNARYGSAEANVQKRTIKV